MIFYHHISSRRLCAARGFTLIEMLLVVSLIALLIALLMPSLSSSRCQAEKLGCMSNLRAMGSGIGYHLTEKQQKLPGPSWYGQHASYNHNTLTLARWLAEYMGHPKPGGTTNINNNFICPSYFRVKPDNVLPQNGMIYGAMSEPNPASGKRVFGYPAFNSQPEYAPSIYKVVRNPSAKQAVKDIDQYLNPTAGWVAQTARVPIHCYNGTSTVMRNALFFDWHVETRIEYLNGGAVAN